MSTILLSFWSLQFQSRTRYLKARKFKPSRTKQREPPSIRNPLKAAQWHSQTTVSTPTSLNKSTDPAGRPDSNVGDTFLQQLHLLLNLQHQQEQTWISALVTSTRILNAISITLICFAKSFMALASPLKVVSCLGITQTNSAHVSQERISIVQKSSVNAGVSLTWWAQWFEEQSYRRWE